MLVLFYIHKKRSGKLHFLGSNGASNDFNQLASNDSLSGSVEQNLVSSDHVSGVLGSVLWHELVLFSSACDHCVIVDLHPWRCGVQTVRRRDLLPKPSTGSWLERTPASYRGFHHRFRRQQSWLFLVSIPHSPSVY